MFSCFFSFFSIFLLLNSFIAFGQDEVIESDLVQQLDKTLDDYSNIHRIAGNIIIRKDGKTLFKKNMGLANVDWNIPHSDDSKFMIASLSKQFTAYAILLLEAEGKLKLEDSISNYIPLPATSQTSPENWEEITLYHLLTHTSGIIRDVPNNRTAKSVLDNIVASVLGEVDLKENPLGYFSYSNLGYLFLAKVIESASQQAYGRFLQNRIFIPNRMYQSGEFHRSKVIRNMSSGYFYGMDYRLNKRCCDDASNFVGSHGLYSTASDINTWQEALLNKSNKLNQAALEMLLSLQNVSFADKEDAFYGFGLIQEEFQGQRRIWHEGREWGFMSLSSTIPELGITITVLCNQHDYNDMFSEHSTMGQLNDELSKLLIDSF